MQVKLNEVCMHMKFGGCGLFSFGDFAPFQTFLLEHDSEKILID